tara:strand:+ start:432 stop:710 length:279 start_codon:yes stop_codon:yes gene_type:complete
MALTIIENIEKEEMTSVEFSPLEKTTEEISILTYKLNRALINGNTSKIKYTIIFNTTEGLVTTKTTVWFVGSKYVLLKSNIYIPINAIKDIV